jgi:hypothetical protein
LNGHRRGRVLPIITAALVATVWLTAAPVPAVASCSPAGRPNEDFAGYAGTQLGVSGVRDISASIREYAPYVTSGSEVTQWVMLNNGGTKWAQVGWWQTPSSHRTFVQYTNDSGGVYTNFWSANGNGYNGYEVSYTATTHLFTFFRNGSMLTSPAEQWAPASYQMYGETHRKSDQMPGGTSNHSVFMYAKYNYTTSITSNAHVIQPSGKNWYGASKISAGRYEIWDKGCSS